MRRHARRKRRLKAQHKRNVGVRPIGQGSATGFRICWRQQHLAKCSDALKLYNYTATLPPGTLSRSPHIYTWMEDAVLAPIQSAKSADYEGGSGFNAAVKPSERTTNETPDTKTGDASHGMEDPALTPVQAEPKKCTHSSSCNRLSPARQRVPLCNLFHCCVCRKSSLACNCRKSSLACNCRHKRTSLS